MNENPLPLSFSPGSAGERWIEIAAALDSLAVELAALEKKALTDLPLPRKLANEHP